MPTLAVIDPWTGGIWFGIGFLVMAGVFFGLWRALRGRWRWVLVVPGLAAALVTWAAFDSMVLAPIRWQRDGVCSGWWQAVPTYLEDGTYNRTPDLCIAPM